LGEQLYGWKFSWRYRKVEKELRGIGSRLPASFHNLEMTS
jgi:hypothetical protein